MKKDQYYDIGAFEILSDPEGQGHEVYVGEHGVIMNTKDNAKKSSEIQASFTLFKAFVGSGILALPASFAKVGLGLSLFGILLAGFLTYYCIMLLIKVVEDMNRTTPISLTGLIEKVVGRWGRISADISLVIMQLGIAIAILIFSTHFMNKVFCNFGVDALCNNNWFMALFAAVIVVPLSFITNTHYLYIPSLMATGFIYLNIIVQLVYNFQHISALDSSVIHERLTSFDFTNLPLFFGVATYAFEGIGVMFSVRNSMEKPNRFAFIFRIQLAIVSFMYMFFPASSSIAFGDGVQDIVLLELPQNNYFYLVIQILYVLSALLGYPLQLLPAVQIMEHIPSVKTFLFDDNGNVKRPIIRYGLRICLIGLLLFIALEVQSFSLFLNLLGSGVFIYLGFLLPIIVYQVHFRGRVPKINAIINSVGFVISVVLGVLGVIVSLEGIIDYAEGDGSDS